MNIFQNLWGTLGIGAPMDEYEYDDELGDESVPDDAQYQDEYGASQAGGREANKVVGMPGRGLGQSEMLVFEPRSFEEIPPVVLALKQRKSVILNLSLVDADTAQRCVDFVAGGAFAVDGHQQRIGETIFLFTPSSVHIHTYSPTEVNGLDVYGGATTPSYPSVPQRPSAPAPAWSVDKNFQF
ncbi:MAG TPA: cell division protein SepF [Crinalium sp.]|jgi:cell division inhibitor SepF